MAPWCSATHAVEIMPAPSSSTMWGARASPSAMRTIVHCSVHPDLYNAARERHTFPSTINCPKPPVHYSHHRPTPCTRMRRPFPAGFSVLEILVALVVIGLG